MNNIFYRISLLILVVMFWSCTEEIDMDFKSGKPQLVVDGVFTDQVQNHFISLSSTAEFLSNVPNPPVVNANVSLNDGQNNIQLSELSGLPGTYLIPSLYHGIYGKTYTLSVSGVDIDNNGQDESYKASNTLNLISDIDSVGLKWSTTQGQKQWQVLLYTKEPEQTDDYYAFTVYLNNELITPKLSETVAVDDRYFNGNDVSGVWVQSVIEEDNDGEVTDHVLKEGDWVKLEMQSINKDYHDFIKAVDEETGIKVPLFSGPPANVPTNVSNNGRGFFRVYSLVRDSIQVTKEILEER